MRAAGFGSDGGDSARQQLPVSWPDARALRRESVTVKMGC